MKEIRTEIALEAPIERIWELLSDFSLYPHWNPLFEKVTQSAVSGDIFELVVHLPEIGPFTVKPKLLKLEPKSKFWWQSKLLFDGLLTWTFCCELEVHSPDRLKFIQRSQFKGLLAPIFDFGMTTSVTSGMEQLNQAVQRWGEKGNVQCLRC